jgi:hypothetical protein
MGGRRTGRGPVLLVAVLERVAARGRAYGVACLRSGTQTDGEVDGREDAGDEENRYGWGEIVGDRSLLLSDPLVVPRVDLAISGDVCVDGDGDFTSWPFCLASRRADWSLF